MIQNIYTLVLLAIADWLIATTISRARVFRPLRAAVKRRSDYLGEGISCQYCISHWVGFILAAIYQPRLLISGFWLVDVAVSAFIIIGLGALIARNLGHSADTGIHPDVSIDCLKESLKEDEGLTLVARAS